MYKWNTDKITAYLETLACLDGVHNDGQGGDVDTDNLRAKVRGTENEYIFVCGFNCEPLNGPNVAIGKEYITDPTDCDVEMIEVTDRSGHGLQSDDFTVAQAYIEVRQHFVGAGASVVTHLKDYF